MIVSRHSTGGSPWHKGRRTGVKRSMGQLAHGPAAMVSLLLLACQASGQRGGSVFGSSGGGAATLGGASEGGAGGEVLGSSGGGALGSAMGGGIGGGRAGAFPGSAGAFGGGGGGGGVSRAAGGRTGGSDQAGNAVSGGSDSSSGNNAGNSGSSGGNSVGASNAASGYNNNGNGISYDRYGGYNRGELYYWGLAAFEAYGYWEGDCYGCGVYVWGWNSGYPTCPSCQYYDPSQAICVSTPACFGGSCPACQYLDPSCQCCKYASGCNPPAGR